MSENWKSIIDYEDYKISTLGNVFSEKSKKILKSTPYSNGYLSIMLCSKGKTKRFSIHRLLAKHFLDNFTEECVIDHIDGNKVNNSLTNLRICNYSENNCNRKVNKKNSSGYKGISKDAKSNFWLVQIKKEDYRVNNRFTSLIEAINYYNKKALELHNDFALLNEIPKKDIILDGKSKTYLCKVCNKNFTDKTSHEKSKIHKLNYSSYSSSSSSL